MQMYVFIDIVIRGIAFRLCDCVPDRKPSKLEFYFRDMISVNIHKCSVTDGHYAVQKLDWMHR